MGIARSMDSAAASDICMDILRTMQVRGRGRIRYPSARKHLFAQAMESGDLVRFEQLCQSLYSATDPSERQSAESVRAMFLLDGENAANTVAQALASFGSSSEHISQCEAVIDQSTHPYALLVAATALTKLVTTHWNNFTSEQRVDIRTFLLLGYAVGYVRTNAGLYHRYR